jgi:DNA-binding GntR family transcriptional regulator
LVHSHENRTRRTFHPFGIGIALAELEREGKALHRLSLIDNLTAAVHSCPVALKTHNRVLQNLLERLSTHLIHTPRSTLSVDRRWEDSLDEHEALVQAIAGTSALMMREG